MSDPRGLVSTTGGPEQVEGGAVRYAQDTSGPVEAISPSPIPPAGQDVPAFEASALSRYAWYDLEEVDQPLLAHLDPTTRRGYERLGKLPAARRYELGSFVADDGRLVSFQAIPELEEVGYSEVSVLAPGRDAAAQDASDTEPPSPLRRFLQLTDRSVGVRRVLSDLDDQGGGPEVDAGMRGREFVDHVFPVGGAYDVLAREQQPELIAPTSAASAEPGWVQSCFDGGDDIFAATYCHNIGRNVCFRSQNKGRHSSGSGNSKVRVSHSRVAACGGVGTLVEHRYRKYVHFRGWRWLSVGYLNSGSDYQVVLGGHVKYWKYVSGYKRHRAIDLWGPSSSSSYFRAWTSYY